jgi:alpha-beta hydrolase superfamily lysophospholipase
LYGHSLGGGIVLDYILRKQPSIKGAIVTSPWIKLAFEPDRFKLLLASVMKNIIPGLVQPSKLIVDHLSHDPAVVARYISDPLVHDKISVGLFHSAMTAAARTLTHANEVIVPILLVHGSNDMICSPEGSRIFALNSEKVELKIWEGGYHELHNEPFKKEVFDYIMTWLSNHI